MVEAFHRVAESRGQAVDVVKIADNGQAVAHLNAEIGRGEKIDARTIDTGGIELIAVVETE